MAAEVLEPIVDVDVFERGLPTYMQTELMVRYLGRLSVVDQRSDVQIDKGQKRGWWQEAIIAGLWFLMASSLPRK